MKKHLIKVVIFLANIELLVFGIFFIKEKENNSKGADTSENISPQISVPASDNSGEEAADGKPVQIDEVAGQEIKENGAAANSIPAPASITPAPKLAPIPAPAKNPSAKTKAS